MNGWLVLGRCGMDDIVLRVYADRKMAEAYANNVTESDIAILARNAYGLEVTVFLFTTILEFRNGTPVTASMEMVKELADSL